MDQPVSFLARAAAEYASEGIVQDHVGLHCSICRKHNPNRSGPWLGLDDVRGHLTGSRHKKAMRAEAMGLLPAAFHGLVRQGPRPPDAGAGSSSEVYDGPDASVRAPESAPPQVSSAGCELAVGGYAFVVRDVPGRAGAAGYAHVRRGDVVRVLYVGVDNDEAGWIYVAQGWLRSLFVNPIPPPPRRPCP